MWVVAGTATWSFFPNLERVLTGHWWLTGQLAAVLGLWLAGTGRLLPVVAVAILGFPAALYFVSEEALLLHRVFALGSMLLPLVGGFREVIGVTAPGRRRLGLGLLLLGPLLALYGLAEPEVEPYGDEPLYLLNVHSFTRDLDWELTNNFYDPELDYLFQDRSFMPGYVGSWGVRLGFPLLLSPAFWIASTMGVTVWLCLLAAACMVILLEARYQEQTFAQPSFLVAAVLLSPLAWFTGRVFTEIPAALFCLVLTLLLERLLLDREIRPWMLVAMAVSFVGLATVKVRFFPLVAAYGVVFLWVGLIRRKGRFSPLFLGGWLLSLAALLSGALALDRYAFDGVLFVRRFQVYFTHFLEWIHPDLWGLTILGLLFDQEYGLFFQGPLLLLLFVWLVADREQRLRDRLLLVLPAGTYIFALAFIRGDIWFGGLNPPSRFLIVLVPSFAWLAWRGLQALPRGAVGIVLGIGVVKGLHSVALVARPSWQIRWATGRDPALGALSDQIGGAFELWLPSVIRLSTLGSWLSLLVVSFLGAAGLLLLLKRRDDRQTLAPLVPGTVVLVVGGGVALAEAFPIPLAEAEYVAREHRRGTLPYPDDPYPRIRQDLTDEFLYLVMEEVLAHSAPVSWVDPARREIGLVMDAGYNWWELIETEYSTIWITRRLFWPVRPLGVTVPPGRSITFAIPRGAGTGLGIRAKRGFEAWQPDLPARLELPDGGTVDLGRGRRWEVFPVATSGLEGRELTLRVPEDSVAIDIDRVTFAGGAGLESTPDPAPLQPLEQTPVCFRADRLHVAEGHTVPWPNGWALRTEGQIGCVFDAATERVRINIRYQGAGLDPRNSEIRAIVNGEVRDLWLVEDLHWQWHTLELDVPRGRNELILDYRTFNEEVLKLGLFAVDVVEIEDVATAATLPEVSP